MDTQSTVAASLPTGGTGSPGLAGVALQLLGRDGAGHGGLEGLEAAFARDGLGERFASWVASGPNLPVSAAEVTRVLGPSLASMAAATRTEPGRLAAGLADVLPRVVDGLTPDGRLPGRGRLASLRALARLLLAARRRGRP
jgi:uncharacterized protein YidB (DUF937 family)